MRYLSVCSGIEAASVAWEPLGWTPVGFSEIDPFASSVLKERFPNVPNFGDMTKHKEWPLEPGAVDLLVGGTPCQSFSVAGLRKGLSDPRGGLMLTYLEIAQRLRPRWVVWENVPGVLSSGGGRDFGSFLGALGELGYGWAYRVLDAQWCRVDGYERAVPQRRRRVFVIGCLGDPRRAAAVLFERESVQRDSSSRRTPREDVAGTFTSSLKPRGEGFSTDFLAQEGLQVSATVTSKWATGSEGPAANEVQNLVWWDGQPVANTLAASSNNQRAPDLGRRRVVDGDW
jgi:DNA (cytosine-5)-methyltransferase 1